MTNPNFNDRHIIKVMLQIAKNKRLLSKVEAKYDLEIQDISENRTREITSYLIKEGCVSQHFVLPERTCPSIIILPYASSKGEGLSKKGEDLLEDLINSLEKGKSLKIKNIVHRLITFIATIISGLIIGYILWKCGWL